MSTRSKKDEGLGKLSSLLEIKITMDTDQVSNNNNEEILAIHFLKATNNFLGIVYSFITLMLN